MPPFCGRLKIASSRPGRNLMYFDPPIKRLDKKKSIVAARWVLPRKVIEGKTSARARLVVKGLQDPDLRRELVETAGCVDLRSSHLQ